MIQKSGSVEEVWEPLAPNVDHLSTFEDACRITVEGHGNTIIFPISVPVLKIKFIVLWFVLILVDLLGTYCSSLYSVPPVFSIMNNLPVSTNFK